ncbi:HxlR family transcriptional regulator [Saccharopolyspora subtropica]|uniref:HxlR family transcriptional regulator n=1 Tax=Saccharopolyspora thermophila TaxID=89367 RepID=A0A917K3B4_9PSEU|nr:helix-turn-helix domain-containing protein [Saccharopolyspora subtropica]GGI98420.1 HxlR family transcriptional regulator [Saccharopolyspora subtropica]
MAAAGEAQDAVDWEVLQILALVGDKWSLLVIGKLRDGPQRFGELQRGVRGISQRMLTLTLRKLERDGLVNRTVQAAVPPRVDYRLTALGESLLGPVLSLVQWAVDHRDEIVEHRSHHDRP